MAHPECRLWTYLFTEQVEDLHFTEGDLKSRSQCSCSKRPVLEVISLQGSIVSEDLLVLRVHTDTGLGTAGGHGWWAWLAGMAGGHCWWAALRLRSTVCQSIECQLPLSFLLMISRLAWGCGVGPLFISFLLMSFLFCWWLQLRAGTCLSRTDILVVKLKIKSGNIFFLPSFRFYVLIIIEDSLQDSWL